MGETSALAVVLVSGGMDSLTTAAIAQTKHKTLAFLHLSYGQKTAAREKQCFYDISDFYKIAPSRRKIVEAGFLGDIGGSSLTDKSFPVEPYQGKTSQIPNSYVPFRNTHIIALAVSWAEVLDAKTIYIGAVVEDSSGYPDCRPSYYKAYNNLIKEGTKNGDIRIETPIIHMKKSEIIREAHKLKAPLELSYSCYARSDLACGVCDSCALRLKGFREAGLRDPILYV